MSDRPIVAIVGAGFSGLLTALHLAADPDGPQVRLIERSASFGRGAAFSTANPDHLLNVRSANMSALPGEPDHFTRWLAGRGGWSGHGGFVTRGVYGDYLQDLLRQALETTAPDRLLLEQDEAVEIVPAGSGWRVKLALGRELAADAVVLALGVLRPAPPPGADPELFASPRYFADPWSAGLRLDPEVGQVLLLGTGLTMVDVTLSLARPNRRIWAISRRGLLPRTHAPVASRPPVPRPYGSPLALLRLIRAQSEGGEWREAIDDLRPHVQAVWRSWSPVERAAFLRHLRPWWDVSRHRLSPSVARQLATLMRARDLTIRAGEVMRLTPGRDQVEVVWRPRGGQAQRRLAVGAVVNCAGFLGDVERTDDPLLARLLARGLIRPDPHRLGVDVDAQGGLRGEGGAAAPGLYAVGPLTRGAVWEMTSVPDIRIQAAQAARTILRGLPGAAAWRGGEAQAMSRPQA
jgi:uncharacterized NAD(P)/FAD-binding protein YdhS